MRKEQFYVIIPCFNEAKNIKNTVAAVSKVFEELSSEFDCSIILIDDGSIDSSFEVMEEIDSEMDYCKIIKNPKNYGLGTSVLNAVNQVPENAWVTVTPGDNEFIFDSIKNHLKLRKEYDLILGYVDNELIRPLARRLASNVFTSTIQFLYGFHYRYLNGFKLYRAHVFQGFNIISTGHAFNAELIAKAKLRNPYIRIGEAPFLARGRFSGNSKAFSIKSIFKSVLDVLKGYRSVNKFRDEVIKRQEH